MSYVKVENYDNRGDDEVKYGFVYFADGRRVAYTANDTDGHVHPDATGGWGPVTPTHVTAAEVYLREQGVLK